MTYDLRELDTLAKLDQWTARDTAAARKALLELAARVRELEAELAECRRVLWEAQS